MAKLSKRNLEWGQHCGTVGEAATCNADIAYGHCSETWLHFRPTSLLMHLRGQQKVFRVPGPLILTWENQMKLLLLASAWA